MKIEKSPFLKLDEPTVLGFLKAAGTRDPDVLHGQQAQLLSAARLPKLVGIYLMVMGGLLTILIIPAFIGIPLLILGWWVRGRGVKNLELVETTYAEFIGGTQAEAASKA